MSLLKNIQMFWTLSREMYASNRERGKTHQLVRKLCPEVFENPELLTHTSQRFILKTQWYTVEMFWLCERFKGLANQKSSMQEQKNYIYMGVLASILDWLVDDVKDDLDSFKRLLYDTKNFEPRNFLEQYYVDSFAYVEKNLDKYYKKEVLECFYKGFKAQGESKKQKNKDISQEEVDKICKDKMKYIVQMAFLFTQNHINSEEEEALYELGGLVQFINDAQDIHKDTLEGIHTFANMRSSLREIERDILTQNTLTFAKLAQLNFSAKEFRYLKFTFEAFVKVTQERLKFYDQKCNYNFSLEKFVQIPKEQLRFNVFAWKHLKSLVPKIFSIK